MPNFCVPFFSSRSRCHLQWFGHIHHSRLVISLAPFDCVHAAARINILIETNVRLFHRLVSYFSPLCIPTTRPVPTVILYFLFIRHAQRRKCSKMLSFIVMGATKTQLFVFSECSVRHCFPHVGQTCAPSSVFPNHQQNHQKIIFIKHRNSHL